MSTPARNAPCPCGSGKKYKRCCLAPKKTKKPSAPVKLVPVFTELDQLSNSVYDLIRKNKLDEAEAAGKKLLHEYPDEIDGFDRLAEVYEARGDTKKAVEYYRKAADFAESAEGFDKETVDWFRSKASQLITEE